MISKNKFKYLRSLKIKKYRNQANQILIEGVRLIDESIKANARIQSIYYLDSFLNNINNKSFISILQKSNIPMDEIDIDSMGQLSDSINNQGVIGLVDINLIRTCDYKDSSQLILDSISDPGNLGNIIRTSDWFGFKNIYLSNNSIDPYNPKVVRSAMGAHFYLNIIEIDIIEHITNLKNNNFKIIAADLDGQNIHNWTPPNKWAIILGNEAHGISDEIYKLIDYKVTIPKHGNMESLNVSMAAGILLSCIKYKG